MQSYHFETNEPQAQQLEIEKLLDKSLSSFFEVTSDAVAFLESGKLLECNPAALKLFGFKNKTEFRDKSPLEFSPEFQPCGEKSANLAGKYMHEAFARGNYLFEWLCYRVDSTKFWVEILLTAVKIADKQVLQATLRSIDERKIEQEKLLEKIQFLENIWSGVNHGILVLDVIDEGADFQHVAINPAMAKMSLISAEKMLGATIRELLSEETAEPFIKRYRECVEKGENISFEESLDYNGEKTWWQLNVAPLKNSHSDIHRLIITVNNVTDRKQAEAEIRQKEEQYRSIFESVSDGISIVDLETGKFVEANPAHYRIHGYDYEEMIHLDATQYIHPESHHFFLEAIRVIKEGNDFYCQAVDIHKNGTPFDVDVKITPYIYKGKPHALAIVRDISTSKAAEAQLKQQAQRGELLNSLTNKIRASLDFDTILETTVKQIREFLKIDLCTFSWYCHDAEEPYWETVSEARNPELPSFLGRYPASSFGLVAIKLQNLSILQLDDIETFSDDVYKKVARTLGVKSALSIPMQASPEMICVVSCTHHQALRLWTEGEVELLQGVMVQLAIALKQAELYNQSYSKTQELEATLQQLQRTQSQLIQGEKMCSLGQLVAGVAHEINNPVNFIHGNLTPAKDYIEDLLNLIQLYQKHYPEPVAEIQSEALAVDLEFLMEDLPKLLASMKVGTQRIRDIVLSLRNFSRLDEADFKEANIHEGIDSTLMILQYRLKDKEFRPEIKIIKEYGNLPLVECYAGQLNQVFMNILVNAIDALDERDEKRALSENLQNPSTICILTTVTQDNYMKISIKDNGKGIPITVQERLFNPFFTTKPVGKGTGMGLSISSQIITERHGGKLQCISTPGNGAEFIIKIPVKQENKE